jgi:hypothetical protein
MCSPSPANILHHLCPAASQLHPRTLFPPSLPSPTHTCTAYNLTILSHKNFPAREPALKLQPSLLPPPAARLTETPTARPHFFSTVFTSTSTPAPSVVTTTAPPSECTAPPLTPGPNLPAVLLHAQLRLVTSTPSFEKPTAPGCSARLETFPSASALHQGIPDTGRSSHVRSGIKPAR